MIKVHEVDFSEIFGFAEKEYGISWNSANDLFFNKAFAYGGLCKIAYGDFLESLDEEQYDSLVNNKETSFLDVVSKEEVEASEDKARLITAHFLCVNGMKRSPVLLSCD